MDTNAEIRRCSKCTYKTKTLVSLQRHLVRQHKCSIGDVYICQLCDIHTSVEYDFFLHLTSQKHKTQIRQKQPNAEFLDEIETTPSSKEKRTMIIEQEIHRGFGVKFERNQEWETQTTLRVTRGDKPSKTQTLVKNNKKILPHQNKEKKEKIVKEKKLLSKKQPNVKILDDQEIDRDIGLSLKRNQESSLRVSQEDKQSKAHKFVKNSKKILPKQIKEKKEKIVRCSHISKYLPNMKNHFISKHGVSLPGRKLFFCQLCNFHAGNDIHFSRHLLTDKHKEAVIGVQPCATFLYPSSFCSLTKSAAEEYNIDVAKLIQHEVARGIGIKDLSSKGDRDCSKVKTIQLKKSRAKLATKFSQELNRLKKNNLRNFKLQNKKRKIYKCFICDVTTINMYNFARHLFTAKHKEAVRSKDPNVEFLYNFTLPFVTKTVVGNHDIDLIKLFHHEAQRGYIKIISRPASKLYLENRISKAMKLVKESKMVLKQKKAKQHQRGTTKNTKKKSQETNNKEKEPTDLPTSTSDNPQPEFIVLDDLLENSDSTEHAIQNTSTDDIYSHKTQKNTAKNRLSLNKKQNIPMNYVYAKSSSCRHADHEECRTGTSPQSCVLHQSKKIAATTTKSTNTEEQVTSVLTSIHQTSSNKTPTATKSTNTEEPFTSESLSKSSSEASFLEEFSNEDLVDELCRRKFLRSCKCGTCFRDSSLYYIHINCHNTDNPLQCEFCGIEFSNYYCFNLHFLSVHLQ